jgi:hypothetical protein
MYNSPCSMVESAAYAFSPAWHAIAINYQNKIFVYLLNGNHHHCRLSAVLVIFNKYGRDHHV